MKGLRRYSVLFALSTGLLAFAQSPGAQPGTAPSQGATTSNTNQAGGAMASSGAIKVLSPKVNEKVGSSIVTLKFQLQNTALAADPSPTYRVQLDGRDPEEMSSTEYSFTGLPVGEHTITIDLVDANHTPVAASHTEVKFSTFDPGQKNKPTSLLNGAPLAPPVVRAKYEMPESPADQLPAAGGELPLLSMVGFGVLVGGVISAMKTRK